jgi:hypothetical protein
MGSGVDNLIFGITNTEEQNSQIGSKRKGFKFN